MTSVTFSLTSRVIGLFALALSLISCLGQGSDQLHGMYDLNFPSTAVCNAQIKLIPFRNVSDSEIVIEGAAISAGTNPDGDFALESVLIGGVETPSINGVLNDVHVPAGVSYAFKVRYSPRQEKSTDSAILDIVYVSPQEGVIQVVLSGVSTATSGNCPTREIGGPVEGLDGDLLITIDRLVLLNGANADLPIRSDQAIPDQPYIPVELPLTLTASQKKLVLPEITLDKGFVLPPPDPAKVPALASLVKNSTTIISRADAEGTFDPETGEMTINALSIYLDNPGFPGSPFTADLEIDVTTGVLDFSSTRMSAGQLLNANFLVIGSTISGSPLKQDTMKAVLVGISSFANGTGQLGEIINNQPAVLRIEVTITDPTP